MPNPVIGIVASAAISGGASLIGGAMQQSGVDKATKAQTAATDKQIALQKEIFEENKANAQPWIDAGKGALTELQEGIASGKWNLSDYSYDDLIQDPGFSFRLEEGTKALDRAAAARGKFISGDQLIGIQDLGQKMASQEFHNAYLRTAAERDAEVGRLDALNRQGLGAAGNMAGVAGNYASMVSQTIQQGANNTGNLAVQGGQNWANAVGGVAAAGNQGIENWMLYDRLAQTAPANLRGIY